MISLLLRDRCYNGGSHHKFEARYDEEPGNFSFTKTNYSAEAIRSLLFKNVYIKDICVWCGKEIKK